MPTLKKPATAAAKPAPKLAASKGAAPKTGLAVAKGAKPAKVLKVAAPKEPTFREGQVVTLLAYSDGRKDAMFEPGARLTIVKKEKDEDKRNVYSVVAEADADAFKADPESVDGDQVFGSEIAPTEKVVVDPYAIAVPTTKRLTTLLKSAGGDALKAAHQLLESASENMFYLGGCLAELYKDQAFRKLGDYADEVVEDTVKKGSGWEKFCQEQFNINGRKGEGYILIYRQFASLPGIDLDAIAKNQKIGWVKLAYMAPHVTAENAETLLETAEGQNVHEFRDTIRTDYVTAEGSTRAAATPKIKRTTFTFRVFQDQGPGIALVLDKAQKQLGVKTAEEAFEVIVMQWANDHMDEATMKKAQAEKRKVLNQLKKDGVDIESRQVAAANLEQIVHGEGDQAAAA